MYVQEPLEQLVVHEMAFLERDYGFRLAQTETEGWITRVDYLRDEIAIEVEVDSRETDLFLLLVHLDEGRLPNGYYVCNGKRCRIHLLTLIEMMRWPVDPTLVQHIRALAKKGLRERRREDLEAKLADYRDLLVSCIDRILAENGRLFSGMDAGNTREY